MIQLAAISKSFHNSYLTPIKTEENRAEKNATLNENHWFKDNPGGWTVISSGQSQEKTNTEINDQLLANIEGLQHLFMKESDLRIERVTLDPIDSPDVQ